MGLSDHLFVLRIGVCVAAVSLARQCFAQVYVHVFGGPTYDASTGTGFPASNLTVNPTYRGDGIGAGESEKFVNGLHYGVRAFRWRPSDLAATELGSIGLRSDGFTECFARAMNSSGMVVGYAKKYSGMTDLGERAARWAPGSAVAVELGHLGLREGGVTSCFASAVNSAGAAVGSGYKVVNGENLGRVAIRWDADSTLATELGSLGVTPVGGTTMCEATAINDAGVAVGYAPKYIGPLPNVGDRAVRWPASSTTAVELGHLGTDNRGITQAYAYAINGQGTAVGFCQRWVGNRRSGSIATRWELASTAAVPLQMLSVNSLNESGNAAVAINDSGTAVGRAGKWSGSIPLGPRAVRWDAGQTGITELGVLDVSPQGYAEANALAINNTGVAVGWSRINPGNDTVVIHHAAMWRTGTAAIDLNAVIDPNSGWVLTEATGISESGWIAGLGLFDPDGSGVHPPYRRAFLMRVPPACPGDMNGDGAVNTADLVYFLGRFGGCFMLGSEPADFNQDGCVTTADLVTMLGRFGRPC